ncbi:MAG: hypothetical protein A2X81_02220 [Desulfobacterales bacterium GWB2_56_26]|nr:MAG: hypothetical protein A2X81_02220 [Desulfobacterales bacterium GWB2_56_26]
MENRKNFDLYFAFGIASLVLAVLSLIIPGFGIIISGISGFMAWISIGKGFPYGAAAVILNLINIFLLSPGYILVLKIEESLRTLEQADLSNIWKIVFLIQVAAIIIFIVNFAIDNLSWYRKKEKAEAKPLDIVSSFNDNDKDSGSSFQKESNIDDIPDDVPYVTKVLVNKIHGGRKKDSKFWNEENDLPPSDIGDIAIKRESSKSKKVRRSLELSLYPVISLIVIVVVLIIARPDLFPFFNYHNIYKSLGPSSSDRVDPAKINTPQLPRIADAQLPTPPNRSESVLKEKYIPQPPIPSSPPAVTNIPNTTPVKIERFSTSGKVFSWRDSEGKFFFSNTNFPLDNDTLQVQTEINTYHKVTKINIIGNQIYVPVTIGNNGKQTTLHMLLDTGCSQTTIPYKYLDTVDVQYNRIITSTLADGSKVKGNEVVIDFIKVGSKKQDKVTVTGQEIAGSKNSGLLGLDFLRSNSFKVDFENRFIIWM